MGLRNMRERAHALPSGRFSFQPRPGGGMCVAISFLAESPGR